jgi:phosphoglycolate phosphatase-like HAD superfamily hydrolase
MIFQCLPFQIAICTSDSREGTHEFLAKTKLEPYVDMIMCGDDPEGKPKPNPHNALHICNELNVSPSNTIMVGDTPADTLMGQQAALGLTIGVLTGVGSLHDLTDADIIVSDVKECVDMILPDHKHPRDKPVVYQVQLGIHLTHHDEELVDPNGMYKTRLKSLSVI